jgi:hypothetical protein
LAATCCAAFDGLATANPSTWLTAPSTWLPCETETVRARAKLIVGFRKIKDDAGTERQALKPKLRTLNFGLNVLRSGKISIVFQNFYGCPHLKARIVTTSRNVSEVPLRGC